MANATRATLALQKAGVAFTLHPHAYDPDAERKGLQAAEALGEPPECVLKTLMVIADGEKVCAVVPSNRSVSMKKLAAAFGAKHAQMMAPADAERATGYKVGGISPFGQMRRVRTAIDADALAQPHVYVNGGQRGLQVRLEPAHLVDALGAVVAPITT
ncbi:Cys-tRNA(Pro) deacylase [Sphingomonas abietis]|uniref:Cys-tRNA(Pro)/Cys-tRNA(Cys) deacylase n=1 Tax=Sphingomonas abietis TaxID=3012344 RepID=A0ABY7NRK7_9SPHN|nr:Cys-tRNA(Pro) deacylase [Sphingomonas abietis]WBO24174.1 Cys-tRNA(Pro) deacylase [Sphingomonas abietis]